MPRPCTVCVHAQRDEIEQCLIDSVPFRIIAARFGTSTGALQRHNADHLPTRLVEAKQAAAVASADDLFGQVVALRERAMELLNKADRAGDYRTALQGIREARACIELLLEVEGRLDRRNVTNLMLAPQWLEVRSVIIGALDAFPDAATAVATALLEAEGGVSHAAD